MKDKFLLLYGQAEAAVSWCHNEFRETANNLMRDMRSLRALWNWLYLALYIFLCVWTALHYGKEHLGTAIVTTGGIVGTIFTVYVWSTTREKAMQHEEKMAAAEAEKPHEDEEGASD
jgi:hypothetical protein